MIEPLLDIPRVFALAFLEILLSADNAVVLGVLSNTLPLHLRKRALFIGVASAFFLRAAALALLAPLLKYTWIQLAGAGYLLYLCLRYFTRKGRSVQPPKSHSFWKTVFFIELLDLVFAIDSIVAGVAFINGSLSKLWIVYVGGMIGLLGIRYAAGLFSRLLDSFPKLERAAYLMVGWIGIKLGVTSLGIHLPALLFWSVLALFFSSGFFDRRASQ